MNLDENISEAYYNIKNIAMNELISYNILKLNQNIVPNETILFAIKKMKQQGYKLAFYNYPLEEYIILFQKDRFVSGYKIFALKKNNSFVVLKNKITENEFEKIM